MLAGRTTGAEPTAQGPGTGAHLGTGWGAVERLVTQPTQGVALPPDPLLHVICGCVAAPGKSGNGGWNRAGGQNSLQVNGISQVTGTELFENPRESSSGRGPLEGDCQPSQPQAGSKQPPRASLPQAPKSLRGTLGILPLAVGFRATFPPASSSTVPGSPAGVGVKHGPD